MTQLIGYKETVCGFFFLTLLYLSDNWNCPTTCSGGLSDCLSRDPVPQTDGQSLPPHTSTNNLLVYVTETQLFGFSELKLIVG